ncbi:cupin-like domain-containing protein [Qipengyuania qiaonensis]|uniref:Cupin-like domain-containing protein n=1 Tax=Qipengyuania qiaonensis TaxID=2867240 RepID=A0ABS7J722_9SPHN|nr:cupin-like domain-containing protein [Qipengyuania qiaonensis]MBX7483114.1 cupin-like domain-containing protein [Qipengyuania qiaonensis]
MTAHDPALAAGPSRVFPQESRAAFAGSYPEQPHVLRHDLMQDDRLALDALAAVAEALPGGSVEYNLGDLPVGVDGKPGSNGLSIGETIRHIATSNSWAVLKNIEQVPEYRTLLLDLLEELRPDIEAKTGAMLTPQGYVFISSPNAVTPYHFDPEHNILLQLRGSKVMTQFPAGNNVYAPDEVHESYHLGGPRELPWNDDLRAGGTAFAIEAGEAVYVPVMAPHFVRNGSESSISLSITWRSEWSYDEAGARCFNGTVRKLGLSPRAPHRWPGSNRLKCLGWRAYRKLVPDRG